MLDALDALINTLPGRSCKPSALSAGLELGPLAPLARALLESAAPRESLLNLRKLCQACPGGHWPAQGKALAALVSVLSSGPELARLLARRPARLELLLDPTLGRPWSMEELARQLDPALAGVHEPLVLAERLAGFRNDQFVRLAACEFGLASLEQVGRELATLADLCLDRAMRFAIAHQAVLCQIPLTDADALASTLAAVGLGKYGAQELNFCSDIDLVFIYSSDEGAAGELSWHEFYSRVCQLVVKLLSESSAEGFSFRVDLRLRPEGSRGPICNSLLGAERYYESWGGPYDRLAWLKARSVAGDLALGREMIDLLRPFVFPRSLRPEVLEDLQELNRRIQREQRQQGALVPGWNVKLESGGIREVEFFVQALQLLHAGKQPALQERATLRALDKLLFAGLIREQEHRQLAESYALWRRLEHRLQLYDGRQTHFLPAAGSLREQLTRHLGYEPAQLAREIARRRGQVSAVYATLAVQQSQVQPEEELLAPLLDPELPLAEAAGLTAQAGFAAPERAAEQILLLAAKPWGPLGPSETAQGARLGRALLLELASSPDPDAALVHVVDLTLRLGPAAGVWRLLAGSRPLLRRLCSLFGSSDYLARLSIAHPDLLQQLLAGGASCQVAPERLAAALDEQLAAVEADDVEGILLALHRFRAEQVLRIGACDIAGDLALDEVWRQLSALAEGILARLYPLALAEATARYGTPRAADGSEATMCLLGLGKLGGGELTYGSDLDLIFLFSAPGSTDGRRQVDNGEFFARVAQRLIRNLSATFAQGALYAVDTRLRPSGSQGTLVTSWDSFVNYHQAAQIWERQVLIKARPVAGDRALAQRAAHWTRNFVFAAPLDPELARQEIARLRRRMETELAVEAGAFYNLKHGQGGILDVEFIAQYLQLRHGARLPQLQVPDTLRALEQLGRAGVLAQDQAQALISGYRFLRRIEGRLRIVRDRAADRLPATGPGLEVMARRLGYRRQAQTSAGEQLLTDYRSQTRAIRASYEEIFGDVS